jgi:hypothetical protein
MAVANTLAYYGTCNIHEATYEHHDSHYNDTQYNDTHHDKIQHNDTQHNCKIGLKKSYCIVPILTRQTLFFVSPILLSKVSIFSSLTFSLFCLNFGLCRDLAIPVAYTMKIFLQL